jgi:hypothetical protein
MPDLDCHECGALVTELGQSEGVFCRFAACPGDRLSPFDVTNTCAENTFCLNFAGERVEVRADVTAATRQEQAKRPRRKPLLSQPTLFE